MSLFGGTVDVLRQATVFASRRHQLLAENVANAQTPNFRARDLSFEHELSLAQKVRALPVASVDTPNLDVRLVDAPDARLGVDGNNVDIDRQMARISENALYHNVVVQLLVSRFGALKSAINGHA